VRPRSTLRKDSLLIRFRQPNIAMAMAVDVHEHCRAHEKGIFVDSRILTLGYARQAKNPLS
jgi:hypothetical protein